MTRRRRGRGTRTLGASTKLSHRVPTFNKQRSSFISETELSFGIVKIKASIIQWRMGKLTSGIWKTRKKPMARKLNQSVSQVPAIGK